MAPTPYFLFGAAPEDAAAADTPGISDAVARPRLRRQAPSGAPGTGRQQAASGGGGGVAPKKPPQRGLGVAELERLRCGGVDPLHDFNAAAAAAVLEAAAVNMQAQSNALLLQKQQQQHHHHYLPAFDAATGSRYYSPLLVQPPPAAPAPPAPVRYVQGVAPEQQYFMDSWGCMGGFVPAGNGHPPHLQVPALEYPTSQSTIWRPACSSASCLHAGQRCDLCSKGIRAPAAVATTNAPDYPVYDLAAAMSAARKIDMQETAGDGFLASEGRKEVREIEFFPTRTTSHGGGPDESELRRTRAFSSSSAGGVGGSAAPLDLSLKL